MRSLALLVLAIAATGCTVYRVNRAATVPHLTPTLRPAGPNEGQGELTMGASSVTSLRAPEASDRTAGVEIPGTQLEGAGRFALGPHITVGFLFAEGLESTAQPAKPGQPDVDGGDVRGGGFVFTANIPTSSPQWNVGIDVEHLLWSVPYVEYGVCVENCELGPTTITNHGRTTIPQIAVGVVPTYRTGETKVFGGVTLRNHPTIEQKGVEVGTSDDSDVEAGPLNLVVSAGVETELVAGLRGGVVVYGPINGEPVRYGPSIAATLTLPLGKRATP